MWVVPVFWEGLPHPAGNLRLRVSPALYAECILADCRLEHLAAQAERERQIMGKYYRYQQYSIYNIGIIITIYH